MTALALIGAGCASAVPSTDLPGSIARATGTSGGIELRIEGDPLDAAASPPDVLTLPEAVGRTVANSPEVQEALARVRGAEADAKQARLLPNPVVSVVFRWPEGGGKPTIEAGLAANLVSLLTLPGRTSAADNRLRAASAEGLSEVLDVLVEVQERYVAIQANDELLVVMQDRLGIVDRLLDTARSRLNLGEGTRLDVQSLEAQRVQLESEIADRQLERRQERLTLARLMGNPSGPVEWRVTPWALDAAPATPESRWVSLGLEHRPEVLQQRFELAALGADYELTGLAAFDGAQGGIDTERDDVWSFGPSVSAPIPLFDFGQAKRQRAQASMIEARHVLTRVQRQVVEETRRAHAAFVASRENLERIRGQLIPLAQRRLEQAEAQFKGGQTDVTGLLAAEEQLRAARTRLVELERRTAQSLIQLERAVGGRAVVAEAK